MSTVTKTRHVAGSRRDALEALSTLAAVGLQGKNAVVYQALLQKPRADSEQLAAAAGLNIAELETICSHLVNAGLIRRSRGRVPHFRAVSPDATLGPRLAARETELHRARDAIRRLEELHRAGGAFPSPSDLVEVVVGAEDITARVDELMWQSQIRICGFDKPPYVGEVAVPGSAEFDRLRSGVDVQVVYDTESLTIPDNLERVIAPLVEAGEQARVSDSVPMKLMMFDDEVAILPVVSGVAAQAAFVVRSTAVLAGLLALFDLVWAAAVPIGTTPPEVGESGESFASLLPLLAAGHTDAGIARALGWSERTTQRRVQALMQELGARTRFQAGIAAHERGWLGARPS